MAEAAMVDRRTGAVTIRLSRVVELLESVETGTVRDFRGIAARVLVSEGDVKFEFYSRRIFPRLAGLIPILFFRESMGEFFLSVIGNRFRRDAAGITADEADFLQTLFCAGCKCDPALDRVFLVIDELDLSAAAAVGIKPISVVERHKEPVSEECLDLPIPTSTLIPLLESCTGMLERPECLEELIDSLDKTSDRDITLRFLVGKLNEAYNDPAAVSFDDILTVRERITSLLPFFAIYPPRTGHTAPPDIHHDITVEDNDPACPDRLALGECPLPDDGFPCPIRVGDAVFPRPGSIVEATEPILFSHPKWSIEVPRGTVGRVSHIDDRGRPRVEWREFEWPRFPLPLPGEDPRRGYEVRSFPLGPEQFGSVRILDKAYRVSPPFSVGSLPITVAECVDEAARCLLEKFRCLAFDVEFQLCPLPYEVVQRVCVSCGIRLDMHGFEFAEAVVAKLDRLLSQTPGMVRKVTEHFAEKFKKERIDDVFPKFIHAWRGFDTADSIVVQGDRLCASWGYAPVFKVPTEPSSVCVTEIPDCVREAGVFPMHDELAEVLAASGPDSDELLPFVNSIAADVFANACCGCASFDLRSVPAPACGAEDAEGIRIEWNLQSSWDLSPYGGEFLARVSDAVRELMVCDDSCTRRMLESARETVYERRREIGFPSRMKELWDAEPRNTALIVAFLAPWMDPDLLDARRWDTPGPAAAGDEIAGFAVQPDATGNTRVLDSVSLKAGREPTGTDVVFRFRNIDAGQVADAFVRLGETESVLENIGVAFSPGDRLSGTVLLPDTASGAANIEVEAIFVEEDGSSVSLNWFIDNPFEGRQFVGQTHDADHALTTVCIDSGTAPTADVVLRLENLDSSELFDATLPAGRTFVSVPAGMEFAAGEALSVRALDISLLDAVELSVTTLMQARGVPQPETQVLCRVLPVDEQIAGFRFLGGKFEVILRSTAETLAGGFDTQAAAEGWLVANLPLLAPAEADDFEIRSSTGGEEAPFDRTIRKIILRSDPPPAGRDVVVALRNADTGKTVGARLPVGLTEASTDVEFSVLRGNRLFGDVAQDDDGLLTQTASAARPLNCMRLFDEDPSVLDSTIVRTTVSTAKPPVGASMIVRFENISTGERTDVTLPAGQRETTATVGLAVRDRQQLRVLVLRAGFGAEDLTVEWVRRFAPAGNLTVTLLSVAGDPPPEADGGSCGFLSELEEFVGRRVADEQMLVRQLVDELNLEFDRPFARRLSDPNLLIWQVVAGERLGAASGPGNILPHARTFCHDDLTPEFLALLPMPECPSEEGPPATCPLEALIIEGKLDRAADTVVDGLIDALSCLRFEVRAFGENDGTGLVVCVPGGQEICFKDDRESLDFILQRFIATLMTGRRDALRKAVEHVNDLREKVRVPVDPPGASPLIPAARRLRPARLSESYLIAALSATDPLLVDSPDTGLTSFIFFGGGRPRDAASHISVCDAGRLPDACRETSGTPTRQLVMSADGEGTVLPELGTTTRRDGEIVRVTAFAADGWVFDHWRVFDTPHGTPEKILFAADPQTASTTVTITEDVVVEAVFLPL